MTIPSTTVQIESGLESLCRFLLSALPLRRWQRSCFWCVAGAGPADVGGLLSGGRAGTARDGRRRGWSGCCGSVGLVVAGRGPLANRLWAPVGAAIRTQEAGAVVSWASRRGRTTTLVASATANRGLTDPGVSNASRRPSPSLMLRGGHALTPSPRQCPRGRLYRCGRPDRKRERRDR